MRAVNGKLIIQLEWPSVMLLVNSWVVWCDMQAKCIICICTYDGIKVGLLYNNAGYVM